MKTFYLVILLLTIGGLIALFISPSSVSMLWAFPVGVAADMAFKELTK